MWSKIRVAVAEDHPFLRSTLAELLGSQPDMECVGQAADGEEAVRLAAQASPHVLLMDVSMPRRNGIDATRQIAAACPGVHVIAFSLHSGVMGEVLRRAGAADYIVKGTDPDVLLSAIRTATVGPLPV